MLDAHTDNKVTALFAHGAGETVPSIAAEVAADMARSNAEILANPAASVGRALKESHDRMRAIAEEIRIGMADDDAQAEAENERHADTIAGISKRRAARVVDLHRLNTTLAGVSRGMVDMDALTRQPLDPAEVAAAEAAKAKRRKRPAKAAVAAKTVEG